MLVDAGAILGRLAGDQAIGYFVPGIAGPEYARAALDAAVELLRATGHTGEDGPWIPLGVGVHAGNAYLGVLGEQGGPKEMTALGDDINIGARLADNAGLARSSRACNLSRGSDSAPPVSSIANCNSKVRRRLSPWQSSTRPDCPGLPSGQAVRLTKAAQQGSRPRSSMNCDAVGKNTRASWLWSKKASPIGSQLSGTVK